MYLVNTPLQSKVTWALIPTSSFMSYVTLDKVHNLSVPWFLHLTHYYLSLHESKMTSLLCQITSSRSVIKWAIPCFPSTITYLFYDNFSLGIIDNTMTIKTWNPFPWNHLVGNTGVKDMCIMSNMHNKPSKNSEKRETTLTWGQSVDITYLSSPFNP